MNRVSPNTKASPTLALIIGRRVRELRVKLGISQVALANLTGISQAEVSQIENGRRTASIGTLLRLAESIGVNISEFLYEYETTVAR